MFAAPRHRPRAGLLAVLSALFASAAFASAASATVFVETSGTDTAGCGTTQATACQTINFGISQSLGLHETIKIGTGTFVEQVTVNKDVVLQGDGLSSTAIAAPASLATAFTTSGPNKPIVLVNNSGSGARVQDLTIDGRGHGNANTRLNGLDFYNAGGTSHHIRIVRVRDEPLSGAQQGAGMLAFVDDA